MAVAHDAADLRQVLVPLHQRAVVRRLLLLTRQQRPLLLAGIRLQQVGSGNVRAAVCNLLPVRLAPLAIEASAGWRGFVKSSKCAFSMPRTKLPHLPHADVHVVAAGEDVGGVAREAHREDSLHALRVVHLD